MVCKYLEKCQIEVTLTTFSNICAVTDGEDGCDAGSPHTKNPVGWRHYFRITYNMLYGESN